MSPYKIDSLEKDVSTNQSYCEKLKKGLKNTKEKHDFIITSVLSRVEKITQNKPKN